MGPGKGAAEAAQGYFQKAEEELPQG